MYKKHDYVEIELCVLTKDERAAQVPKDTKEVPLMLRTKGFLLEDGRINEEVSIITATKRIVKGTLVEGNPFYKHTFGGFVYETQQIRSIIEAEAGNLDE